MTDLSVHRRHVLHELDGNPGSDVVGHSALHTELARENLRQFREARSRKSQLVGLLIDAESHAVQNWREFLQKLVNVAGGLLSSHGSALSSSVLGNTDDMRGRAMLSLAPRCRTVPLYQVVSWMRLETGGLTFDAYLATIDDFGTLVRVPALAEGRAFE